MLFPEENAKDLADIPDNVKNELEIVPVSVMDEVLKRALVRMPEPIDWTEPATAPADGAGAEDDGASFRAL